MGDAERKGLSGLREEGERVGGILGVIDGQMNEARAAVDGDVEVAFAPVSVGGPQLWQMFDVDMNEAEIVLPKATLSLNPKFALLTIVTNYFSAKF